MHIYIICISECIQLYITTVEARSSTSYFTVDIPFMCWMMCMGVEYYCQYSDMSILLNSK